MQRFFLLLPLLSALCGPMAARTTEPVRSLPASDARITWIGRTLASGDSVKFDWTGVYARLKFKGSSLTVSASDTKKNYYNVWLDRSMDQEPDKVVAIRDTNTTLVLFSPEELRARYGRKQAGLEHTVVIQKRTEGEQGVATFVSFSTEGTFLQADPPKERILEYVGDSYTCGYGAENSIRTDPFKPETENQNKTYADILARYFGADQIVLAHSGMGIARNYNDNLKGDYMPDRYCRTFDTAKEPIWDARASRLRPSITVIYLGTNDFSTSRQPSRRMFTANYIALMKRIKENYGEDYPILCIAPMRDPGLPDYVRGAVEACGLKNVHFMALWPGLHNDDSDLGASGHPNYEGHRKKACAILPYISTIMGWPLDGTSLR